MTGRFDVRARRTFAVRARCIDAALACVAFVGAALACCVFAAPAAAATITVTSLADSGSGSLRAAIVAAAPGDTILVPAGQITLTSGPLGIDKNLTIAGAGPGATAISGDGASGVIAITASPQVTLSGLTITGGNAEFGAGIDALGSLTLQHVVVSGNHAGGSGVSGFGGGIDFGPGTLDLIESSVSANTAGGPAHGTGFGGGIEYEPTANGQSFTLEVTRSEISGNTAGEGSTGFGGGIEASSGFEGGLISLAVEESSISNNTAGSGPGEAGFGGGIELSSGGSDNALSLSLDRSALVGNAAGDAPGSSGFGGGVLYTSGGSGVTQALTVTNTTIAANSAGTQDKGFGGGIDFGSGTATLAFATIVDNRAGDGGSNSVGGGLNAPSEVSVRDSILAANFGGNCTSPLTSAGHNIDDGASCGLTTPTDKSNTNPQLGALGEHGGPTPTLVPLAGSPAIDGGDTAACPASDQRGEPRPQGAACDIGAVEVAPPLAVTGTASAVGETGATLSGSAANPSVAAGSEFFQVGASTAYGSQTSAQPLAARTNSTPFSATLAGLAPGTTYHFRAVAVTPDGTSYGADQTFTTAPVPPTPPVLSKLAESHARWRAGSRLASIARRARKPRPPLGTTFTFTLNEAAKVTFAFTQPVRGRKLKGRCVAATHKNRRAPSCKRTVTRGTLVLSAHAGANKVSFQGRASASRRLAPGRYTVLVTATNAAGQRSQTRSLTFTIVK